jgi:plastocyanin
LSAIQRAHPIHPFKRTPRRSVFAAILTSLAISATAKTYIVTANPDMTFTPDSLTIYQHDQIIFENAGGTHNVHADNNSFVCSDDCSIHNGPSSNPWQHTITFNSIGTVGYYCDAHASFDAMSQACSGMCGSITVIDRIFVDGFEEPL